MLKKLLFFMCAAAMLTLTGCFEMVEEVYLNRDGSGKYLISIDMSDLFSDPMMKGIMEQAAKEQAGQNGDRGFHQSRSRSSSASAVEVMAPNTTK